jgi:uroporphyrinogen-III synthase
MRQSREAALSLPPLLLTRPAAASARFADLWRARGSAAPVLIAPVTEIRPVPHARPEGVAIFTSAHAPPLVPDDGRQAEAWCVGPRTAEAALVAGYRPRVASPHVSGGTAEDLAAAILASRDPGSFVHFRGREARGDLAARLRAGGRSCAEIIVYAQESLPLSPEALGLLAGAGPVMVPLFSPRSAKRFAAAVKNRPVLAPLWLAMMSAAVRAAWNGPAPARVEVAKRPDAEAMIVALTVFTTTDLPP